ncbi:metallophosphoesterase [Halorubrum salinarum]|uniref:Metallophosphoesterase n=1 Tax=Halorubrum salinarum TaxID=2739057 RepID=A0A7D4CR17_9EURY|nr:metallophosphoesterase [Halorubrum salinarum]QKG91639.1 metallophosphoesterase [Halorubrum salinarum]
MTDRRPGAAGPTAFADAAFAERAVYLRAHDALVVADLHVGRGEASAVSLPLGERRDLVDRLDALLDRFDPGTVVVAGDAVHTFDRVTDRARGTLNALRDRCEASGATLELVAGNHDAALADAWDGPVSEELVLTGGDGSDGDPAGPPRTVVRHGHEAPAADRASTPPNRYVIGHVHPTIEIEGDRRPCFLAGSGTYRGADLLVVPAFTRLAAGVPVNDAVRSGLDSPLVTDAAALAPVVYDPDADAADGAESALRFPPLGEFDRLL